MTIRWCPPGTSRILKRNDPPVPVSNPSLPAAIASLLWNLCPSIDFLKKKKGGNIKIQAGLLEEIVIELGPGFDYRPQLKNQCRKVWIPAFAGMTSKKLSENRHRRLRGGVNSSRNPGLSMFIALIETLL